MAISWCYLYEHSLGACRPVARHSQLHNGTHLPSRPGETQLVCRLSLAVPLYLRETPVRFRSSPFFLLTRTDKRATCCNDAVTEEGAGAQTRNDRTRNRLPKAVNRRTEANMQAETKLLTCASCSVTCAQVSATLNPSPSPHFRGDAPDKQKIDKNYFPN